MQLSDKQWDAIRDCFPVNELEGTTKFGGRPSCVGRTRGGKQTKIMAVVDGNGLPIAIGIESGQRHEAPLVQMTLEHRFVDELPERLIGDKAYDSDKLDEELAAIGIEMIAPNRSNRNQSRDGRPLRRYRRRWLVERLFSWLQQSRRLVTRYEYKAENFLGLLQLGCMRILLRRI